MPPRPLKTVIMFAFLLCSTGAIYAQDQVPVDHGNHFIVLIDDSKDTGDLHKFSDRYLPKHLYGGSEEESPTGQKRPTFREGTDTLSVAFFAIRRSASDGCGYGEYSTLPEHILNWQAMPKISPSKDDLVSALNAWKEDTCRRSGSTPLYLSRNLALAVVNEQLPESKLFRNTYIIVYSNRKSNVKSTSMDELMRYESGGAANINETKRILSSLEGHYFIETFPHWEVAEKYGIFYTVYQVVPRNRNLEGSYNFLPNANLDRVAISRNQLKLTTAQPNEGRVFIRVSDTALPFRLRWRARDAHGNPWEFSSISLSDNTWKSIDLTTAFAAGDGDKMSSFSFFEQDSDFTFPSSADTLPPVGEIEFSIDYQILAPSEQDDALYNRLLVTSRTQTITLEPEPFQTIVRGAFLDDVTLDYPTHTRQWRESDGELTQTEAAQRIKQKAEQTQWYYITGIVLVLGTVLILLFQWLLRSYYHRPFAPTIAWMTAAQNTLDFNNLQRTPMLLGYLDVSNPHDVPWFGKRLNNQEQPARQANIQVVLDQPLQNLGFRFGADETCHVGFFSGGGEQGESIVPTAHETIVHGKQIPVYFDPRAVRDFIADRDEGKASATELEIGGTFHLQWSLKKADKATDQPETLTFDFALNLRPETAKPPAIDYVPSSEALHFQQGQAVPLGAFIFHSTAQTHFAEPFQSAYFTRVFNDHKPVSGAPITLMESHPVILPKQRDQQIPVTLFCDGQLVINPKPTHQEYQFTLYGPSATEDNLGPHPVKLLRDKRRGQPVIELKYLSEHFEVYWQEDQVDLRRIKQNPAADPPTISGHDARLPLVNNAHFLPEREVQPVFELCIGNSGTSGDGYVRFKATTQLSLTKGRKSHLHLAPDQTIADLFTFYNAEDTPVTTDEEGWLATIPEHADTQFFQLKFDPTGIERIDDGHISHHHCHLQLKIDVEAFYDGNQNSMAPDEKHTANILIPFDLKLKPGPGILCLDFGTSAIAAAIGSEDTDEVSIINLQAIEVAKGVSYGKDAEQNLEADGPFLPSWVMCHVNEPDDRPQESMNEYLVPDKPSPEIFCPPGFHRNSPVSNQPGDPGFLIVPPTEANLRDKAELAISSIKSWFGEGSGTIKLNTPIYLAGADRPTPLVPTDGAVCSALAALVETYIKPAHYQTDQVVLTCPNTFTPLQRKKLLAAAQNALISRLGLISRRDIRLISESDAIAFYYCQEKRKQGIVAPGSETLLVYDFGGGTLDLSAIRVEWSGLGAPKDWQVLARLGVPIAGNYLDERLAHIIHRLLSDPEVLDPNYFNYKYTLLEDKDITVTKEHKDAILNFWKNLKLAKHGWDGKGPIKIHLGDELAGGELVTRVDSSAENVPVSPGETAHVFMDGPQIMLQIPEITLKNDPSLSDYLGFVTNNILDCLLKKADLEPTAIDTLLVSGRGVLWPGIMERINRVFQHSAQTHFLDSPQRMKEAVARGAIAAQQMAHLFKDHTKTDMQEPLAILTGDMRLIPESEWGLDKPINLEGTGYFRLIQVSIPNPNPREDHKNLNRYFYRNLVPKKFLKKENWENSDLYVVKEQVGDNVRIKLMNQQQKHVNPLNPKHRASTSIEPPWPVGKILLSNKEPSL